MTAPLYYDPTKSPIAVHLDNYGCIYINNCINCNKFFITRVITFDTSFEIKEQCLDCRTSHFKKGIT